MPLLISIENAFQQAVRGVMHNHRNWTSKNIFSFVLKTLFRSKSCVGEKINKNSTTTGKAKQEWLPKPFPDVVVQRFFHKLSIKHFPPSLETKYSSNIENWKTINIDNTNEHWGRVVWCGKIEFSPCNYRDSFLPQFGWKKGLGYCFQFTISMS